MRDSNAAALAPGSLLGGSQAGARLTYRLNADVRRPLALSGRIYAPLDSFEGSEVAAGVDWQPLADVPVHLLAERRQALGKSGRSAFSLTAYGGVSQALAGPLQLDAYGQAGLVGMKARDLFADGSAKLSYPAGETKIGIGAWGAAQPGVERVDVGPQASFRMPFAEAGVVVAVDWRLRVAGEAEPKSGPTLTLSTGF
ncbi:MAG TPA: hypothetical protein VGD10_10800 [Allosphingosinicella sp.]|uniref:hypothetical protein n=1 Tax=Allosphingosinicella sp. TaxID=2823234 RepID=UPI002EDACBDE